MLKPILCGDHFMFGMIVLLENKISGLTVVMQTAEGFLPKDLSEFAAFIVLQALRGPSAVRRPHSTMVGNASADVQFSAKRFILALRELASHL